MFAMLYYLLCYTLYLSFLTDITFFSFPDSREEKQVRGTLKSAVQRFVGVASL